MPLLGIKQKNEDPLVTEKSSYGPWRFRHCPAQREAWSTNPQGTSEEEGVWPNPLLTESQPGASGPKSSFLGCCKLNGLGWWGSGWGWFRVVASGEGEQQGAHGGFPLTGPLELRSQPSKISRELSRQIGGFGGIISPVFL